MSAQPAYPLPVDHPPRLLAHGLPSDRVVTPAHLRALPPDPFWSYAVSDGQVLVQSRSRPITWDDLQTFPDLPNWRFELLEGALILTPNAPGFAHQSCALSLAILLKQACPRELATVIGPFEFVPIPTLSLQPDVLIARRPVAQKRLLDAPVLVVEVLSPSTRQFDQSQKQAAYAKFGVEHYWIVDPAPPTGPVVTAWRLEDGEYVHVAQARAGERFQVTEPVALDVDPVVLLDE